MSTSMSFQPTMLVGSELMLLLSKCNYEVSKWEEVSEWEEMSGWEEVSEMDRMRGRRTEEGEHV